MHHAQSFVGSLGPAGTFLNRPLSVPEANQIEQLLRIDAANYLYSACVSIGDAVQAIDRTLFTWATVKLYYSTFYLLRSFLALSGRALVYDESKPRTLMCKGGETPLPLGGKPRGTHKAVISYFTKSFPGSPLLSQTIGSDAPFDWLMARREEANYAAGRFADPLCPGHFLNIVRYGTRRSLAEYISNSSYLYAFDPDHAMVALPIETLKQVISHPNLNITSNTDVGTQHFFRTLFADKAGPLSDVLVLLKVRQ